MLYLALMIVSIIANGSVIISAIFERWKEVDNFTFVMFVSLAFNQLFVGFFIFPSKYYTFRARFFIFTSGVGSWISGTFNSLV